MTTDGRLDALALPSHTTHRDLGGRSRKMVLSSLWRRLVVLLIMMWAGVLVNKFDDMSDAYLENILMLEQVRRAGETPALASPSWLNTFERILSRGSRIEAASAANGRAPSRAGAARRWWSSSSAWSSSSPSRRSARTSTVRARPGRLRGLSVLHSRSFFIWWVRARWALSSLKRRFTARAGSLGVRARP